MQMEQASGATDKSQFLDALKALSQNDVSIVKHNALHEQHTSLKVKHPIKIHIPLDFSACGTKAEIVAIYTKLADVLFDQDGKSRAAVFEANLFDPEDAIAKKDWYTSPFKGVGSDQLHLGKELCISYMPPKDSQKSIKTLLLAILKYCQDNNIVLGRFIAAEDVQIFTDDGLPLPISYDLCPQFAKPNGRISGSAMAELNHIELFQNLQITNQDLIQKGISITALLDNQQACVTNTEAYLAEQNPYATAPSLPEIYTGTELEDALKTLFDISDTDQKFNDFITGKHTSYYAQLDYNSVVSHLSNPEKLATLDKIRLTLESILPEIMHVKQIDLATYKNNMHLLNKVKNAFLFLDVEELEWLNQNNNEVIKFNFLQTSKDFYEIFLKVNAWLQNHPVTSDFSQVLDYARENLTNSYRMLEEKRTTNQLTTDRSHLLSHLKEAIHRSPTLLAQQFRKKALFTDLQIANEFRKNALNIARQEAVASALLEKLTYSRTRNFWVVIISALIFLPMCLSVVLLPVALYFRKNIIDSVRSLLKPKFYEVQMNVETSAPNRSDTNPSHPDVIATLTNRGRILKLAGMGGDYTDADTVLQIQTAGHTVREILATKQKNNLG